MSFAIQFTIYFVSAIKNISFQISSKSNIPSKYLTQTNTDINVFATAMYLRMRGYKIYVCTFTQAIFKTTIKTLLFRMTQPLESTGIDRFRNQQRHDKFINGINTSRLLLNNLRQYMRLYLIHLSVFTLASIYRDLAINHLEN